MRVPTAWTSWRLGLPAAVLIVLVAVDIAFSNRLVISGSFAVAAVVAAGLTSVRGTAVFAVLSTVLAFAAGAWNHDFGSTEWWVRTGLALFLGVVAVLMAALRIRREQALDRMTLIAEVAQEAVLRAMPDRVGQIRFAARYVSATEAAHIGGDMYEVIDSPFGVRVLIGDVRGKGLAAVQMTATVLAAFRRSALLEASLSTVVADLDAVVTAVAEPEDFVTAVLAEVHDDGTLVLVNCGHPSPLVFEPGRAPRPVDTGTAQLPLGLGTQERWVSTRWEPGTRLLFFTDGLIEARDRTGRLFPLDDHVSVCGTGSLDDALSTLLRELDEHAGHHITDDVALVLAEREEPPVPDPAGKGTADRPLTWHQDHIEDPPRQGGLNLQRASLTAAGTRPAARVPVTQRRRTPW